MLKPISSIVDVAVYGVEIPGREGRAGMIGMHVIEGSNLEVSQIKKFVKAKILERPNRNCLKTAVQSCRVCYPCVFEALQRSR